MLSRARAATAAHSSLRHSCSSHTGGKLAFATVGLISLAQEGYALQHPSTQASSGAHPCLRHPCSSHTGVKLAFATVGPVILAEQGNAVQGQTMQQLLHTHSPNIPAASVTLAFATGKYVILTQQGYALQGHDSQCYTLLGRHFCSNHTALCECRLRLTCTDNRRTHHQCISATKSNTPAFKKHQQMLGLSNHTALYQSRQMSQLD